jgi:hypothetical protein
MSGGELVFEIVWLVCRFAMIGVIFMTAGSSKHWDLIANRRHE